MCGSVVSNRSAGALLAVTLALACVTGCIEIPMIWIDPECPETLRIGQTGDVVANEENPGAVPRYRWTVSPSDAGTFAAPTQADTRFTGRKAGEATLTLTAADGLFQVIDTCKVSITETELGVSLGFAPASPIVNDPVTLTCESVGSIEAVLLLITQTSGTDVQLTRVSPGVVTFTPTRTGALGFQCVGQSATGASSDPVPLEVTISPRPGRG